MATVLSVSHTQALAQVRCSNVHAFQAQANLGELSPIQQLFSWEQVSNLPEMQKPEQSVNVGQLLIPEIFTKNTKVSGYKDVYDFFKVNGFTLWPQHPLNSDPSVPFYSEVPSQKFPAHYSGSGSLFLFIGPELYSVKMPTNRPHPRGDLQPIKARLGQTAEVSIRRSQSIQDFDLAFGEGKNLKVLYDVVSFTDTSSGNGFVVRDLTPLQDGHYYLPGFSLPYAGRQIARRFVPDQAFADFWGLHYAAAVGRAKAELLLRYGLVMETPNAQNLLVQLDQNFRPTGKIIVRDIADSQYLEQAAIALGYHDRTREDARAGVPMISVLDIQTETSFWKMDEAGIPTESIKLWESLHDEAFVRTIVSELDLDPAIYKTKYNIQNFFATDRGMMVLQTYAAQVRGRLAPNSGDGLVAAPAYARP